MCIFNKKSFSPLIPFPLRRHMLSVSPFLFHKLSILQVQKPPSVLGHPRHLTVSLCTHSSSILSSNCSKIDFTTRSVLPEWIDPRKDHDVTDPHPTQWRMDYGLRMAPALPQGLGERCPIWAAFGVSSGTLAPIIRKWDGIL